MLTPFTQVVLAVPPNPPVPRALGDVAAGRSTGAIPPSATVQIVPGGPWLPVDEVLADAGASGPPPGVRPVLAGLLTVPPVLALVFAYGFESGGEFLLALWALAVALVIAAKVDRRTDQLTSAELVGRLRSKPAAWYGVVGLATVLMLLACGSAGTRAVRKSRGEAAFATRDDCTFVEAWNALSEADRVAVGYDRRQTANRRKVDCETAREKTEAAEYEKTCEDVSARMASRTLTDEDRAHLRRRPAVLGDEYLTGDDAVKLAERIAGRALEPGDLARMKKLPCGSAARRPFVAAAATSPSAWVGLSAAGRVDQELLRDLGAPGVPGLEAVGTGAGGVTPSEAVRAAVHKNAEEHAGKIQNLRSADDAKAALDYCMLDRRLGTRPGPSCSALIATVKRLKDAEAVRLASVEARCKAASAARQRCMRACDAKQPQDDLGMPAGDFDDSLACYERCEKANPATGCE